MERIRKYGQDAGDNLITVYQATEKSGTKILD